LSVPADAPVFRLNVSECSDIAESMFPARAEEVCVACGLQRIWFYVWSSSGTAPESGGSIHDALHRFRKASISRAFKIRKKSNSEIRKIYLFFVFDFPTLPHEYAKYNMTRHYANMTEIYTILRKEINLRIHLCFTTTSYRRWSEKRVAVPIAFDGRKAPVHDASSDERESGSSIEALFREQPEKPLFPYRYRRAEISRCYAACFPTSSSE
jgi:hypothetical protein